MDASGSLTDNTSLSVFLNPHSNSLPLTNLSPHCSTSQNLTKSSHNKSSPMKGFVAENFCWLNKLLKFFHEESKIWVAWSFFDSVGRKTSFVFGSANAIQPTKSLTYCWRAFWFNGLDSLEQSVSSQELFWRLFCLRNWMW